MNGIVCPSCGTAIDNITTISRTSFCPQCKAYLHSCVNCEFYSPGRSNDCLEPQAEFVKDKRGANFCDFFKLSRKVRMQYKNEEKRKKAIEDFKRLFGEKNS